VQEGIRSHSDSSSKNLYRPRDLTVSPEVASLAVRGCIRSCELRKSLETPPVNLRCAAVRRRLVGGRQVFRRVNPRRIEEAIPKRCASQGDGDFEG
jgi:hypothetical protein